MASEVRAWNERALEIIKRVAISAESLNRLIEIISSASDLPIAK